MSPRVAAEQKPLDGSPLALDVARLEPGSTRELGGAGDELLVFTSTGSGSLGLDGVAHPLEHGTTALLPVGTAASVTAGDEGLIAVLGIVTADGVDLHAPMGPADPVTLLHAVEPGQATGSRSFQVLYGPHNGCVRATLFVGYIPPGRAPWHYHLYDEIVWVVRGRGRLHLRDAEPEELGAGSAFRLRPREVHIVENLSTDEELAVLGLFTPAGSPSAAYLEPGVLAEYRIG